MTGNLWDLFQPIGPLHSEPGESPTLERAHQVMREHVSCDARMCRRKGVALKVLVKAKHVVPDATRGPDWAV